MVRCFTPEGIENNPMMYELLYELPWREKRFTRDEWLMLYLNRNHILDDHECSSQFSFSWPLILEDFMKSREVCYEMDCD